MLKISEEVGERRIDEGDKQERWGRLMGGNGGRVKSGGEVWGGQGGEGGGGGGGGGRGWGG